MTAATTSYPPLSKVSVKNRKGFIVEGEVLSELEVSIGIHYWISYKEDGESYNNIVLISKEDLDLLNAPSSPTIVCGCGAESVGSVKHLSYCDKAAL